MLHLTGIWITFPVTEFVVCIIAVVFVRKDASKAEMLRIDMALLVSLALNVLSGNRSE